MELRDFRFTGEEYRLSPGNWGETTVMVDEDKFCRATAEVFDLDGCDPDEGPNNRPETVDIAVDNNGSHYAFLRPFKSTGWHNIGLFRRCENPADAIDGGISFHDQSWDTLDDALDIDAPAASYGDWKLK